MTARTATARRRQPAPNDHGPGHQTPSSSEPTTIEKAIELYPAEWIVMIVTGYDEDHCVSEGIVMAHSPSHQRAANAIRKLMIDGERPAGPTYMFQGYPRIRTGVEVRQALAEASADPSRWRER